MMPGADDDGGVGVSFEYGVAASVRAGESKFCFNMIRAERGLVYDGTEANLVLEVRQQHRAREIAGADHIEELDGRGKFCRLAHGECGGGLLLRFEGFGGSLGIFENDANFVLTC